MAVEDWSVQERATYVRKSKMNCGELRNWPIHTCTSRFSNYVPARQVHVLQELVYRLLPSHWWKIGLTVFEQFLDKMCHFWPKCWIGIGWCLVLVARDWYFGYYLFLNLNQCSCKVTHSFSHQNKMTQLFRFLVEFFIPFKKV